MRRFFSLYTLVFLLLSSANAWANDRIPVPLEPNVIYESLSLEKPSATKRILLSKRTGASGESFTKIYIDCSSQTYRVVSEGETLDEVNLKNFDDQQMIELVEGSSKYHQVQYACSK